MTAAQAQVIQIQKYYSNQIKTILAGTKPTDCPSAIKYLIDAVGDYTKPAPTGK